MTVDFDFSDTHQLLRQAVRDFCEKEVRPLSRELDETERFPTELVPRLAEMGLLGILIPEQFGGAGMDVTSYALCVEECSRVDGSLGLTVASHNGLGVGHILARGTEAQKQRYLPRAASGEWLSAWALTEPGAGSDASMLRTRAVAQGDGWVLDGTKTFITQGAVGGYCVVLARSEPDVPAHHGISAFIVEASNPGYIAGRHLKKLGCRWSDTAEIELRQCAVGGEQLLGERGRAFIDTMRLLDKGRIGIGAMALGLGRGALALAIDYARERQAFGKPIGELGAIQAKLADARVGLDAAEALVYKAAWLADHGRPYSTEAACAKLFASEVASRVCNDALQIHGGYGYIREYPVERYLRDARVCEIGEGTSEIQRLVIARAVLRGQ